MTIESAQLLPLMREAALKAGQIILDIYNQPIDSGTKSDGSPVTLADQMAERVILDHLAATGIPVLAEESVADGHIPELGDMFFVVDPLDGTKEFIKRNGEFTVNIALVDKGRPVMGVVTAPALGHGYQGSAAGAERFDILGETADNFSAIAVNQTGPMQVVASRSHGHAALGSLCEQFAVQSDVSVGSSLKFCLVAEGKARFYPRFTPTCEWDTAAGQAVLEAAGGAVLTLSGNPLDYGHKDRRFLNPFFAAADSLDLARDVAAAMQKLTGGNT